LRALRFSNTVTPAYYEQLASELRIVRYARGQPVRRWERKPGAQGRPRQFSAIHGPVERRLDSGLSSPVTI
jgi:hypothetical protein